MEKTLRRVTDLIRKRLGNPVASSDSTAAASPTTMIIQSAVDDGNNKTLKVQPPANSSGHTEQPPSYAAVAASGTAHSQPSTPIHSSASAPAHQDEQRQPLLPYAQTDSHPPQSPGRRFFGAFFVAVFIWLLLSLLVRSIAYVAQWRHKRPHVIIQAL
jgi:hypothetical protein